MKEKGVLQLSTRATVRGLRGLTTILLLFAALAVQAQMPLDVTEASIRDLQIALERKQLSSVDLVDAYLERINAYDEQGPALNAILALNPDARAQAAALDRERELTGARSPLHGIPIILKDNYSTQNMRTTGASKALADFTPNADATQVKRLVDAGAIILAKSNLHEFAYGITTISSLGGQTRNPYDPSRVPGGSSGGTAAAIAASFATVGMGSDTCGSIRIPAAFNDLVGLRPTKGLSSIYGIMPLASTQDVAGPLARNFEDLAVVLDIVSGYDAKDPATAPMQSRPRPQFRAALGSKTLVGLRIGKLMNYYDTAQPLMREQLDVVFAQLAEAGVVIVDVTIPEMSELVARSGVIGQEFEADLNAYLAEFGSTTNLEAIVATGLYDPAVAQALERSAAGQQDPVVYQAALAARPQLQAAIEAAMSAADVEFLAYPPIGSFPVTIGESQPGNNCSLSANSGFPALSVPVGFGDSGLPLGLELLGAAYNDVALLAVGYAVEQLAQARRTPASTPPLMTQRSD
jgi:amidase